MAWRGLQGTELYKEGDLGGNKGNSMYYVSEGQVDLKYFDKKEGKEKPVGSMGRGSILGEVRCALWLPAVSGLQQRVRG